MGGGTSSLVRCSVPAMEAGRVQLMLSDDDGTRYDGSVRLLAVRAPVVIAVEPSEGASVSGTVTRVMGSGFLQSDALSCRFHWNGLASTTVAARLITSNQLECTVPAMSAGNASVSASNDGLEYSSSVAMYSVHDPMQVLSPSPSAGPVLGGTMALFAVSAYMYSSPPWCRFGAVWVAGTLRGSSGVVCRSPALSGAHDTAVGVRVAISDARREAGLSTEVLFSYELEAGAELLQPSSGDERGGPRSDSTAADGD